MIDKLLLAGVGVGLWMMGGWWWSQLWTKGMKSVTGWEKWGWGLVWSFLGLPWLVYMMQQLVGLRIGEATVWGIMISWSGVAGLMVKMQGGEVVPRVGWRKWRWLEMAALGIVVVFGVMAVMKVWVENRPLVGADSGFYLEKSAEVVRTGEVRGGFDRSVVLVMPVVMSILMAVSVEAGLKWMIVVEVVMLGVMVRMVTKRVIEEKWAVVAMLLALVSWGLWRMSWDLHAMMWGIMGQLMVVWWLLVGLKEPKKWRWVLMMTGWFGGVLFNLHGIVAFSSVLVWVSLAVWLGWQTRSRWWGRWRRVGGGLVLVSVMYVVAGYPLVWKGWESAVQGVVWPLKQKFGRVADVEKKSEAVVAATSGAKVEIQAAGFEGLGQEKKSWNWADFPLKKREFLNQYHWSWLVVVGWGLLMVRKGVDKKWVKKVEAGSVVLIGLVTFLLTQQEFLGLRWYSARFVMMLLPWLVIIVGVGLAGIEKQWRRKRLKRWRWWMAILVAGLVMAEWRVTSEFLKGYRATIDDGEYEFYGQIGEIVDGEAPVYVASTQPRWAPGLNPNVNVEVVRADAMCQERSVRDKIGEERWNLGRAFWQGTDEMVSVAILDELSGGGDYFVVADGRSQCVKVELFEGEEYVVLNRYGELVLVKRVR